ncbi:hypothetical protein L5515_015623 [Caenorhabditis briggsae]|uniref:Homeobox domain-containing protein n=1 Tax=Caenorhabditis briggsae TaxID=6238 RepID=A0AAE9EGI8_CAEBR|nr:hypothetical protein L5515_015623 [Caenorhabditis briggsae]
MQPPILETFKTPHNLSNSQILMLKEFFKEFQFLTNERISWIRKRIGSEVETRTIQNWFKEQRDLNIRELEKNPRAEQDLPSEMALLHMTYDREPDIRNIKFLSWATVHQVSEADVRRYYKERTSKEAEGLKRQQIIQNADEPIKQEIEEGPAPIIQNPEEEIKQEIDHNFAIPKIRKRRERLPIVSMQPSELPVTFKNPYNLSNIQVLKLKDFFEEFQFLTEERTSRIRGRIGSEVEIQTLVTLDRNLYQ